MSVFANVFVVSDDEEQFSFLKTYPDVAELLLPQVHKIAPAYATGRFARLAEQSPRATWILLKHLHQHEPREINFLLGSVELLLELTDKTPVLVNKIAVLSPQYLTTLFCLVPQDSSITLKNCILFLTLVNRHQVLAKVLFEDNPDHFAQLLSHLDGSFLIKSANEVWKCIEERARLLSSSQSVASSEQTSVIKPAEASEPVAVVKSTM